MGDGRLGGVVVSNRSRVMRSRWRSRRTLAMSALALAACLALAWPAHAQQQDSISAIRASPQKFWNLEVNVAGLVGRAESSLPGGQIGTYRLVDYTDSTGIAIESDELPAPGRVLKVRGVVVPSRDNATIPIIRERSREALDKPSYLLWVVTVAGILALALGGALLYLIRRGKTPSPGVHESDAARPPVPIVIGGPVKMAPPPVYMPWAQPGARASGSMPLPSLDGPEGPPRGQPAGAGTMPRATPGGTPVVRQSMELPRPVEPMAHTPPSGTSHVNPEGPPPVRVARPTVPMRAMPGAGPHAANPFAMPPAAPRRRAPITQPFEPVAPRTVPFEYTGARLEVAEGPDTGRKVPIGSSEVLIGREGGRRNHLALSDPTVSLAQARIVRDETFGFVLENESRTNRTLMNGEIVLEPVSLENGSEIRMGATLIQFLLGN